MRNIGDVSQSVSLQEAMSSLLSFASESTYTKTLRSCLTLLILDVGDGALAISKATHSMYDGSVLDLGGEITNFIILHMDSNLLDIP